MAARGARVGVAAGETVLPAPEEGALGSAAPRVAPTDEDAKALEELGREK